MGSSIPAIHYFFSFFHLLSKLCRSDLQGCLVLSCIEILLISTVSYFFSYFLLVSKLSNMFWTCSQVWALFIFKTIQYCHLWKDQFQLLSTFLAFNLFCKLCKPGLQIIHLLSDHLRFIGSVAFGDQRAKRYWSVQFLLSVTFSPVYSNLLISQVMSVYYNMF